MASVTATKLSYDELFNSATMFYINPQCEERIKKTIDQHTSEILTGLKTISSKETLKQYIKATNNETDFNHYRTPK